jgi:shikimate dehydrogenase
MTLNFALVGSPIDQSPSPAMHNAAFKALGMDAFYSLRVTDQNHVAVLMNEIKSGKWSGLNITTPLKTLVAPHVQKTPRAARAQAVNTVWFANGVWCGDLTDVDGVAKPLVDANAPRGCDALIIGAGGAARAALLALETLDCTIHVAARRVEQAEQIMTELAPKKSGLTISLDDPEPLDDVFSQSSIIVQTTPVGRQGEDHLLPWQKIHKNCFAFEMLYAPRRTPFLAHAVKAGAQDIEGWRMLLEQGAKSFEIWTGRFAPRDVMQQAILTHLNR